MNIGQAAEASGVSAKMIRYYESIGLIPAPARRDSNYRDYGQDDVHRLAFIKRSRDLGFSIERIRGLMALWADQARSNADVRSLAQDHVAELEQQAAKLQSMIATLRHLMSSCEQGQRAHCPIIEELGDGQPAPALPRRARARRADPIALDRPSGRTGI